MEVLHEPSEQMLANLDRFFDARGTPDSFVTYLASWVDLAWIVLERPGAGQQGPFEPFPPGLGRLRELVARAAYHAVWRGTARGLSSFLETATGLAGFRIDEDVRDERGRSLPYHIRVLAPPEAAAYADLVRRIVEHEKPAHVTFEVDILAGS